MPGAVRTHRQGLPLPLMLNPWPRLAFENHCRPAGTSSSRRWTRSGSCSGLAFPVKPFAPYHGEQPYRVVGELLALAILGRTAASGWTAGRRGEASCRRPFAGRCGSRRSGRRRSCCRRCPYSRPQCPAGRDVVPRRRSRSHECDCCWPAPGVPTNVRWTGSLALYLQVFWLLVGSCALIAVRPVGVGRATATVTSFGPALAVRVLDGTE